MFANVYAIAMSESDEFTEIVFSCQIAKGGSRGGQTPPLKNRVS